ncbi:MAG: PIN domain-containing protein [Treponema sp.]|jgi:predicted nucleic acid-binding protein|nr:PIN domain-containing protein [Treponema sp.]
MKILFDTNIVIDILKCRAPFYENSNKVLMLAVNEKADGIIGTSAITDIYYLTRKQYTDTKTAVDIIFDILEIVKPVDTLVSDIYNAANLGFNDFEDAIIAAIALREKADYIITRDTQDFSKSPVPAVTPDDFLAKFTL